MRYILAAGAMIAASAGPLAAQASEVVRASDPAGMVATLRGAGYEAELSKDDSGDPLIKIKLAGYNTNIFFYGCHSDRHDGCQSIQFAVGFDHKQGLSAEEAIKLSGQYRFMSLQLDDENDPFVT